jgi:hypothetical protein
VENNYSYLVKVNEILDKLNKTPRRTLLMRYVKEESGLLNNFAIEPKVYEAEPPTQNQKRNYIILGAVAVTLIGGLMAVAVSVS